MTFGKIYIQNEDGGYSELEHITDMPTITDEIIVADYDPVPFRKRACINCGRRSLWGAGSRCGYDGHYIGYCATWDDWCKHWRKDRRKPGEIDVYDSEVD